MMHTECIQNSEEFRLRGYLLGVHHQTITGVYPRILKLLEVPRIDPLCDDCSGICQIGEQCIRE